MINDVDAMGLALEQATLASSHDDVPVGCVIVAAGEVIAVGENRREIDRDPSAHAEIVALRRASERLGRWYLDDCDVIVTLEPCVMCAGALLNARVNRLVIGALDEKAGAVGSRYHVLADPRLPHQVEVVYDVLAEESATQLREFFQAQRDPAAPR